jgi:hypothetical protein
MYHSKPGKKDQKIVFDNQNFRATVSQTFIIELTFSTYQKDTNHLIGSG